MTAVDVDATVDGPEDAPVVVPANSLGGMVCLRLAAREPARVHRLAVLCTSAKTEPQPFLDRARAVRESGTAPPAPAIAARWLTPGFAAEHPELVARLEGMIAGCDAGDRHGIPGAQLISVSPGAHLANLERTLEITGALLSHFDEAGDSRG